MKNTYSNGSWEGREGEGATDYLLLHVVQLLQTIK